jgi:hypothetical protein
MATKDDSEARELQLGDAVLDALRGALHIIGGMVQMAAGITRLLAISALKAATAVEEAVEASQEDEEPKPKPSPASVEGA